MVNSKDHWKAWLYLSPAIVLLLIFTVWPIVNTVRMSLLEGYSGLKAVSGASFEFGLGNFVKVIKYRKFLTCLQNTVLLCLWTVPISTILALLIAVALNSIKFLQKALQTVFFLIQSADFWIKNTGDLCAELHIHHVNLSADRINGNDCGVEHPSQNDLICCPEDLMGSYMKVKTL